MRSVTYDLQPHILSLPRRGTCTSYLYAHLPEDTVHDRMKRLHMGMALSVRRQKGTRCGIHRVLELATCVGVCAEDDLQNSLRISPYMTCRLKQFVVNQLTVPHC
jgi:hypothetical protein